METLIIIVHVIVAIFLVATILLQSGKGADIGAAFGAGSSQTVFGPRGAATLLHKVTIVAATLFLATSITLTYFSRQDAGSVLESVPATGAELPVTPTPVEQPASEAEAPAPEASPPADPSGPE